MDTYLHQLPEDLLIEVCQYLNHNEVLMLESLGVKFEYERLIMKMYPAYYEILRVIHLYYPTQYKFDKDTYVHINKCEMLYQYRWKAPIKESSYIIGAFQNNNISKQTTDNLYTLRTNEVLLFINIITRYNMKKYLTEITLFGIDILDKYFICSKINGRLYDKYRYSFPHINHLEHYYYTMACCIYSKTNSIILLTEDMKELHAYYHQRIKYVINRIGIQRFNERLLLLMIIYLSYLDNKEIYTKEVVHAYIKSDFNNPDEDEAILLGYLQSI